MDGFGVNRPLDALSDAPGVISLAGGDAYETLHGPLVGRFLALSFNPCRGAANHSSVTNRRDIFVSAAEMDRGR